MKAMRICAFVPRMQNHKRILQLHGEHFTTLIPVGRNEYVPNTLTDEKNKVSQALTPGKRRITIRMSHFIAPENSIPS